MNKVKSLVLAFTLAAGMGSTAFAQAPTAHFAVPPAPVATQQVTSNQLQMQDIQNAAYNLGVQAAYPLVQQPNNTGAVGVGFAQGTIPGSNQPIGVEYNLNGNQYSVANVYNLTNPSDAAQFQGAWNNAAQTQASLSAQAVAPVVYPSSYYLAVPRVEVVGIGLGIYGWSPYWAPSPFVIWPGFAYRGGWGYNEGFGGGFREGFGGRTVVNNTTIFNNRTTQSFQGTVHGAGVNRPVGASFNTHAGFTQTGAVRGNINAGAVRTPAAAAIRSPAVATARPIATAARATAARAPAAAPRAAAPRGAASGGAVRRGR